MTVHSANNPFWNDERTALLVDLRQQQLSVHKIKRRLGVKGWAALRQAARTRLPGWQDSPAPSCANSAECSLSKPPPIIVTDHCVLRYVERVLGYDIDLIRAGIAKQCEGAIGLKANSVKIDGFIYHFNGCTVLTVHHARSAKLAVVKP